MFGPVKVGRASRQASATISTSSDGDEDAVEDMDIDDDPLSTYEDSVLGVFIGGTVHEKKRAVEDCACVDVIEYSNVPAKLRAIFRLTTSVVLLCMAQAYPCCVFSDCAAPIIMDTQPRYTDTCRVPHGRTLPHHGWNGRRAQLNSVSPATA